MALSQIWGGLPGDLAEQILSQLVAVHFHADPAYTWVCLRQLSAHQKRVIEYRFGQFWLPKLSITLYTGARHKFEYAMDLGTWTPLSDTATFAIQRQVHNPLLGISQDSMPGQVMRQHLKEAWARCDSEPARNITVRLGEGYLNGGCRGGYILNDTDVPGRQILERGGIRFPWKDAMNELLREEMYMRKVGDEMVCLAVVVKTGSAVLTISQFADACSEWCAKSPHKLPFTPIFIQTKLWRCHVQSARRVAALKHRAAKSQTSALPIKLKFAATSVRLHKQKPDHESLAAVKSWSCCGRCSRTQEPDIFEVVMVEESVVPRLEVFQRWLAQTKREESGGSDKMRVRDEGVSVDTILGLYRHEFAWTCQFDGDRQGSEEEQEEEFEFVRRGFGSFANGQSLLLGDDRVRWQLAP
jgi:hypothetical protein